MISLLASPLVKILSAITEIALKILRIKHNEDPGVSEEEVKILIKQGTEAGVFEPQEETLMNRVLAFGDRRVGEIMTQRRQLVSLDVAASFDENLKDILQTPHSYYPVYQGSSDHLIGIISVKDLLESLATRSPSEIDLKEFLREPVFVTESMSTLKLLEKLKKTGTHMALVVDEYGGTAGIVTIVDIIETIVGDMPAVHDGDEPRVTKRDDGSLLVDGSLSIFDLSELLSESVSEEDLKGDYSTVAGLVISQLGHIPKEGEKITWHNYVFEIVDMDGHRVDKVLIYASPNS
jgi:putative hemolysin